MQGKMILVYTTAALIAINTQAQGLKAKLVAYRDCHPDAAALEYPIKPQQCGLYNQGLTFMIEGQNIALVDKDSLAISKLDVKGEDARFNRKGEPAYKTTPTPKVDENSTRAMFSIFLDSAAFCHGKLRCIRSNALCVSQARWLDYRYQHPLLGWLKAGDRAFTNVGSLVSIILAL